MMRAQATTSKPLDPPSVYLLLARPPLLLLSYAHCASTSDVSCATALTSCRLANASHHLASHAVCLLSLVPRCRMIISAVTLSKTCCMCERVSIELKHWTRANNQRNAFALQLWSNSIFSIFSRMATAPVVHWNCVQPELPMPSNQVRLTQVSSRQWLDAGTVHAKSPPSTIRHVTMLSGVIVSLGVRRAGLTVPC